MKTSIITIARVPRMTALLAVGIIGLAACTSNGASPSVSNTHANSDESPSISVDEEVRTAGILAANVQNNCGTKNITLGVHDALGLNNWSRTSMAIVRSEAAKCPNVTVKVAIGQGDLQKSISDINGFSAQGVDALVMIPGLGPGQLASIKAVTKAGIPVVGWAASPGGNEGTDYTTIVDWSARAAGARYADWLNSTLNGQGNVIYLGGPAGNPVSRDTSAGLAERLQKYPGLRLLTDAKDYPVTTWDAASAQKVTAGLLAKFPDVNAVVADDSLGAVGAVRAFVNANRPLGAFATLESNSAACTFAQYKDSNPNFELATISARNWLGRVAVRKAIAAAQGIDNTEPSDYDLPLYEDSVSGPQPKCDPNEAPDTFFSNQLTATDLAEYGKFN